jgi:hypothetical protein
MPKGNPSWGKGFSDGVKKGLEQNKELIDKSFIDGIFKGIDIAERSEKGSSLFKFLENIFKTLTK